MYSKEEEGKAIVSKGQKSVRIEHK